MMRRLKPCYATFGERSVMESFASGGGNGEVRVTNRTSKSLLAWLPQPKQRELEALIDVSGERRLENSGP